MNHFRKTRPPQGLETLTEDVKDQLREWLAQPEITYAKAVELMREKFDVKTSITALCRFLLKPENQPPAEATAGPDSVARLCAQGVEILVFAPGATVTRVQIRPLPFGSV